MVGMWFWEIAGYNTDLDPFSYLHSDIPGSFLTPQSPFSIMVGYSLVYLTETAPTC